MLLVPYSRQHWLRTSLFTDPWTRRTQASPWIWLWISARRYCGLLEPITSSKLSRTGEYYKVTLRWWYNWSCLVSNVSKVISTLSMNQSQPKQESRQQHGLKVANFKFSISLLDIPRYDIFTLSNTLKLISVFRLVRMCYMTFLFMSNQVKGLESVILPPMS